MSAFQSPQLYILLINVSFSVTTAVESVFHIYKDWIITTRDEADIYKDWIITTNHEADIFLTNIAEDPLFCASLCNRHADCFAVNIRPVNNTERQYVCELLPALVNIYNVVSSSGSQYYRKSCLRLPESNYEAIHEHGNIGVKYMLIRSPKLNFDEAIQSCNSYGMKLAAFETEEEYARVTSFLTISDKTFLAGYGEGDMNSFVWLNHSLPVFTSAWFGLQPDNFYGEENCLVLLRGNDIRNFNDLKCTSSNHYICECPYMLSLQ